MGRIVAIDYGKKRVGLAVTDPLKIIANSLTNVSSSETIEFLKNYLKKENVEMFVIGMPKQMNNTASESVKFIKPFIKKLKQTFPNIPITEVDERFTSKIAFQAMIDGGLRKKARQNKALVDEISATIILQSYLEQISNLNC
ncbi:MAG: Holliday junction resolvase RuvX [Bacteroidia bacterium]|nr:MAG: Holliday junction resolvase RuvX [Bacteroidia bacterium]PIE86508.1 MAG: Holliday junction resolvase RuvX [Bacteroidia bacterium]